MNKRQVRMKVQNGRLQPLEDLNLKDGVEMVVVIDLPDTEPPTRHHRSQLRTWDLGLGAQQITREDAYDDTV